MKSIKLILFFTIVFNTGLLFSQSTNFRAQGNYYSAKENFQKKDYKTALTYVEKSKVNLGGTNRELQYLHILCAYNLENYELALKELETYFALEEKKITAVDFDKSVDKLTSDETKALTMLIDPIYEKAEKSKEANKIQNLIDELNSFIQNNWSVAYYKSSSTYKGNDFRTRKHYEEFNRSITYAAPKFSYNSTTGEIIITKSVETIETKKGTTGDGSPFDSYLKSITEYVFTFKVKDLTSVSLTPSYTQNVKGEETNMMIVTISFNTSNHCSIYSKVTEASGLSAYRLGTSWNKTSDEPSNNVTFAIPKSKEIIFEKMKQVLLSIAGK